jgi:hypothetical protein
MGLHQINCVSELYIALSLANTHHIEINVFNSIQIWHCYLFQDFYKSSMSHQDMLQRMLHVLALSISQNSFSRFLIGSDRKVKLMTTHRHFLMLSENSQNKTSSTTIKGFMIWSSHCMSLLYVCKATCVHAVLLLKSSLYQKIMVWHIVQVSFKNSNWECYSTQYSVTPM